MVSRRNFFTMLTLLMIMIFMFMFSSVLKQVLNEYDTNSHAEENLDERVLKGRYDDLTEKLTAQAKSLSYEVITQGDYEECDRDKRVIFLSKKIRSEVADVVASWCAYVKRPMISYTTLSGLEYVDREKLPEVIVVDGQNVFWERDIDILLNFARGGACVIFARMPSPKDIQDHEGLRLLTGIKEVYSENIQIDGIQLFPGFLIGQEENYIDGPGQEGRADLNLMIPWYVTGEGAKVYMMGLVNDRTQKSQDLPSLTWRYTCGYGKVFCICGDYLTKESGIGFLTACMGEKDSYDIYPVINAQNLVLANYGGFSDENGDQLQSIYDQRQIPLFRDVVWPAMISMTERTKNKISLMVSPQLDYEDSIEPEDEMLIYYLKLLNEGYGEAGLSTKQISSLSVAEKLGKDRVYWQKEAPDYALRSAWLETPDIYEETKACIPDLKTVVVEKENALPVSYLDDEVTCQVVTSDGMTHTFSQDIALKSLQTALGYSNVVLDLSDVSHPEEEDFADFSRRSSSNLITFWKQFSGFEKTTLSESDARIRRFLALDYQDGRNGNVISLHVDGFDEEAFFILKLNRDVIDEVKGAQITDLKNGFYLLSVSEEDVTITVKERRLFYY